MSNLKAVSGIKAIVSVLQGGLAPCKDCKNPAQIHIIPRKDGIVQIQLQCSHIRQVNCTATIGVSADLNRPSIQAALDRLFAHWDEVNKRMPKDTYFENEGQTDSLKDRITALEEGFKGAFAGCAETSATARENNKQIDRLKTRIAVFKTQISTLKTRNDTGDAHFSSMNRQMREVSERIVGLEHLVRDNVTQIVRLKDQITSLEKRTIVNEDRIRERLTALEDKSSNTVDRLEELESKTGGQSTSLISQNSRIWHIHEVSKQSTKRIVGLEKKVATLKVSLEGLHVGLFTKIWEKNHE